MSSDEGKAAFGTTEQPQLTPEDQRSVDILHWIESMPSYIRLENDVVFLYDSGKFTQAPSRITPRYSIDDFLRAVDFYYQHRMATIEVNRAMQKPDGKVLIYEPRYLNNKEPRAVASLTNDKVLDMLEFAYLLLRSPQATK